MDDLERRWRESDLRSRERRSARRAAPRRWPAQVGFAGAAAAVLGVAIALATSSGAGDSPSNVVASTESALPVLADFAFEPPAPARDRDRHQDRERHPRTVPTADAIDAASTYAAERGGLASFATIDSEGRLRGRDVNQLYSAASVVKAMVLAAELRRLAEERQPIDPETDSLLGAMIRFSDNEAADAVYARVGDAGMHAVAKRAGMTGFEIAGHWGNAQITAADMARFFADLEGVLPARHREYGQSLLGSVIPSQSWGIPVAAGERWAARFKGGWLPDHALVHQAAELRERHGPRQISIAILTDEQPSHGYGVETVEGIAERLLGG